jgi:glycosyltransferase involved in cell wall biosynthesis
MIFIFLYDHKLKSGANKKIQAFMRFVTENKMDLEFILDDSAKFLNLNLEHKLLKFKNRIQKLLFFRQNFHKEKIITDFVGSTLLKKNIYWLIHDIRPVYGYKGTLYAIIYRYLLKKAKNIIVVSNFTKDEVLSINPMANVIIWKNGIATPEVVKIKKQISYDVIMVGAFVTRKGHLEALQLLQLYSENHKTKLNICLVGTKGEILDEIYHHCYQNLILEVNVDLSEDELKSKWLSSKCTLSNSQYEGFNYTVLESLSLLKNVVLTDIPGHSHFKDLAGCYFFSNKDSFGIALERALSIDLIDVDFSEFNEEINTNNFIKSL